MDAFAIFLGLNLVILAGAVWMMICNHRTFKQRTALIDATHSEYRIGDAWSDAFKAVHYNDHLRTLMLFRDGFDLYPKGLSDAAKRGAKPYWEKPNWQEDALKETISPLH